MEIFLRGQQWTCDVMAVSCKYHHNNTINRIVSSIHESYRLSEGIANHYVKLLKPALFLVIFDYLVEGRAKFQKVTLPQLSSVLRIMFICQFSFGTPYTYVSCFIDKVILANRVSNDLCRPLRIVVTKI